MVQFKLTMNRRGGVSPPVVFSLLPLRANRCQDGGVFMIVFDKLWITMKKKGISTYQLREKCGIDSKTIRRLRANENMETKTLDKLCIALSCKLEDIAEFKL